MTTQQIQFYTNRIRANELAETRRHNIEMEKYNLGGLSETSRHNVATEQEANRANVAKEQQALNELQEQSKHNLVTESETNRHNVAVEQKDLAALQESVRHNVEGERLTQRGQDVSASSTVESAQIRSLAQKYATDVQKIISDDKLTETTRANKASEKIKEFQITVENQLRQEGISIDRAKVDESIRQFEVQYGLDRGRLINSGVNTATDIFTGISKLIIDLIKLSK